MQVRSVKAKGLPTRESALKGSDIMDFAAALLPHKPLDRESMAKGWDSASAALLPHIPRIAWLAHRFFLMPFAGTTLNSLFPIPPEKPLAQLLLSTKPGIAPVSLKSRFWPPKNESSRGQLSKMLFMLFMLFSMLLLLSITSQV